MTPEQKDRIVEAAKGYVKAYDVRDGLTTSRCWDALVAAVRAAEPKRLRLKLATKHLVTSHWGEGEVTVEGVESFEVLEP